MHEILKHIQEPKIVYGFHGCDMDVRRKILAGDKWLYSTNSYDWLGHGIYFWEDDYIRAEQWALEMSENPKANIKNPAVIGVKLDLGECLDTTKQNAIDVLKRGYEYLRFQYQEKGLALPKNTNIKNDEDWKKRDLDCLVIEAVHNMAEELHLSRYDSVRGAFIEGKKIYPGAGFKDKTHIQLCVRNPECILEVF